MLRQLHLFHEMEESAVINFLLTNALWGAGDKKHGAPLSRCANMIGVVMEFLSHKTGFFMFLSKTTQDETHETETQKANLMSITSISIVWYS